MDELKGPEGHPANDGMPEGLSVAPDDLDGARLRAYVMLVARDVGGDVVVGPDGFSVDAGHLDRPGSGYDRQFRDAAYTVWGWGAKCSFSVAAKALRVGERTLRYWSKSDNWVERFAIDRMSHVPEKFFHATAMVLAGYGVDAADYLGRVVTGDTPADKTRVAAALGVLDRLGLAPVRALSPPTLDTFTGQGGSDAPRGPAPTDGRSMDPVDALRRG